MRGSTRNSIGEMPMVVSASISSFTFMVPSWAAKAAPVRPAMMIAGHHRAHLAHHGDADQVGDVDLRRRTAASCTAPTKARITPTRKLIRVTIGSAPAPQSWTNEQQVDAAEARPAAQQPPERERDLADEGDDLAARLARRQRRQADARKEPVALLLRRRARR